MKKYIMVQMILTALLAGSLFAEVTDPGFESDTLLSDNSVRSSDAGDWLGKDDQASIQSTGGSGGGYYLQLTDDASIAGAGQYFSTSGLVEGTSYLLRFDLKVVSDGTLSDNVLKIYLGENNGEIQYSSRIDVGTSGWAPGAGASLDVDGEAVAVTSAQEWTTVTSTGAITLDSADTFAFVGFWTDDVLTGGYIGIDNVQFVEDLPVATTVILK